MSDHSFSKKHLRLVDPAIAPPNHTKTSHDNSGAKQLSLFEVGEPNLIFSMEQSILRANEFNALVGKYNPKVFFDLRIAPRLDFVAPSRVVAFKIFSELKLSYVDVFGALGVNSYNAMQASPEMWSELVGESLLSLRSRNMTSMFVFDDIDILNRANFILPSFLKRTFVDDDFIVKKVDSSEVSLLAM